MRDARYDMHFSCREMHESIGEYFQLLVGRISTKVGEFFGKAEETLCHKWGTRIPPCDSGLNKRTNGHSGFRLTTSHKHLASLAQASHHLIHFATGRD